MTWTTVGFRGEQRARWQLMQKAFSSHTDYTAKGNGTLWIDFVLDCLEEIDLLGYVKAYKRVDEMRREYYDDYE